MTSKQKHDPGYKKREKNKLLNPDKLDRQQRLAKRHRDRAAAGERAGAPSGY